MTWDRLRLFGYILALLLLGAIVTSLYAAFRVEIEKSAWAGIPGVGFFGGLLLGAFMVALIAIILISPDRRRSSWVRAVTAVNTRYLFLGLILLWMASMGFLASLGLEANTVGVPALVGLFAGIFIFMGFIWSVIGE